MASVSIGPRDSFAEEIGSNKEELKLEIKAPSEKQDKKYFLSVKGKTLKREWLKTKKIFKPEVGIVEVVTMPHGAGDRLSLEECISIAIKNHLPLQIAQKNAALAKMRIWEARRNMLPTVTIAYEESIGQVYGRYYTGRKQYIEGQQPIFHGGELYWTMKQTETNLKVVENDARKIKNELILQVKKGYYTLAKAEENLKIQRRLLEEVEAISDRVDRQFASGIASKLELLNVNSQASQARYQLLSAEGDEAVAEIILKQAMNLEPKDKIRIEPSLEFKKVEVDYEKVLAAAYVNRPEMKINSLMIDYYYYGKGIAKAKGWPKIDLMGQWGLAKEEYTSQDMGPDPITGRTDADQKLEQQWYAGIKASVPFWGSTAEYSWTREQWVPVVSAYHGTKAITNAWKFKVWDRIEYYSENELADIDFYRARQELIKVKQDITLEVREGCFNYEKALKQLETAENKVKYQEKDLEIMMMKRGLDEAQDSNVIESMIKAAQEKFGYLQALTDCHLSLASINKAIGAEDYFKDEKVEGS